MTAREDIAAFLAELRALIAQGNFRIEARNYPDMFAMGIDVDGVILEVQTLTVAHYSQGPEPDDRGREGDIWILGKDVGIIPTYIKIRVVFDDALCISFHPAMHSMALPYRYEESMKQFKCDQCDSVATHVVERDELCRVKGEEIVVNGAVRLCDACGERVFDRALDSAIFQQAFEVYRTRYEMMTPADIVRLREMYDLTQRSLSALLGLGEVTIHRYEKGSIPDEAHHQLLRLIRDPRNMKQVYAENRIRLSPTAQRKLEATLGTLLGESGEALEHQLQDPLTAALYLEESARDSTHALLVALRDIVQANGGVSSVARKAAVDSESLTSVLSEDDNRELCTLQSILDAMGMRMSFTAKAA